MKIEIEKDDEQSRIEAITSNGRQVGRFNLRAVTGADISFFERAGISEEVTYRENGKSLSVKLGDFYSVYASAYILGSNPKVISRQLFDIREFAGIVDDWVIEKNITRAEFIALAEAVGELNREWRTSTSESNGNSGPGN